MTIRCLGAEGLDVMSCLERLARCGVALGRCLVLPDVMSTEMSFAKPAMMLMVLRVWRCYRYRVCGLLAKSEFDRQSEAAAYLGIRCSEVLSDRCENLVFLSVVQACI